MLQLRKYFQTVRILPKALAQAPVGTIRKRLITPMRKHAYRAKLGLKDQYLVQIDRARGVSVGNQTFWNSRKLPDWVGVSKRLKFLSENHPEAIPQFAKLAYSNSRNPTVLINLARSVLTRDAIRACLLAEDFSAGSKIQQRMRQSQMDCASLVAIATLLLENAQSETFVAAAKANSPELSKAFMQLIDSCGTVLTTREDCGIQARLKMSGFRTQKKHRLIITASTNSSSKIGGLLSGADAVTIIALDDLYGRAQVADHAFHANPDCQIKVEHVRSRITRFSTDYHRVHEETRAVSEGIIKSLKSSAGRHLSFLDESNAALALADHLFFPCLRFAAIKLLIDTTEFDHIVIALSSNSQSRVSADKQLCKLLSGIEGLADDPRVEVVLPQITQTALKAFEDLVELLVTPPVIQKKSHSRHWGLDNALHSLHHQSEKICAPISNWPETDNHRIIFATTQVAAYNSSSTAYCDALSSVFDTRVAFLGGNLLSFYDGIDTKMGVERLIAFPQRPHGNFDLLRHWLENFLEAQLPTITQTEVRHVISISFRQVALDGLLSFICHAHLCDAWFKRLQIANQLPKAIVMTPFRNIRVAAFASVARRFNVPSIAIEPHGLNDSYARYCKVTADYYGVITKFFARAAVTGFGMTPDRVPVLGSPRLVSPKDYDVEKATVLARAKLQSLHEVDFAARKAVLCFFSQPSNWEQVSSVWHNIVNATVGLDCIVLLKTHPEEPASRVTAYLDIARENQASNTVIHLETDAISAIEASDLVLTGYSATALEAALYRRPVFCVTNGDVDYPLNQHDVIGAPLFRTIHELREEISSFLEDRKPYQDQAKLFLEQEPQLCDGFEKRLQSLVKDVASRPTNQTIRPETDVPETLFLSGPHVVYQV